MTLLWEVGYAPMKRVSLYETEEGDRYFYTEGKRVTDVVADIPWRTLARAQVEELSPCLYARVVPLEDRSLKLYLQGRVRGGGYSDGETQELARALKITKGTDREVADAVLSKIPPGTYSDVHVSTEDYLFTGVEGGRRFRARVIHVEPTSFESLQHIVSLLFKGYVKKNMNFNGAAMALLGSGDEQDVQALRDACRRNVTFEIAISLDLKYIAVEVTKSEVVERIVRDVGWCGIL